jgi:hypothetical protein
MTDFDNTTEDLLLQMYRNQTAGGGDADPYASAELNDAAKNIKSKVAASEDYFSSNTTVSAEIKNQFEEWMSAQVNELFPNENTVADPGVAGQIAYGSFTRYVNAQGLEYNQLIGALTADQMPNNYLSVLHNAILDWISRFFKIQKERFDNAKAYVFSSTVTRKATISLLTLFFVAQLLIPFRYLLYPGELFWAEEGYRFSWRVMLMEKAGYASFKVVDSESDQSFYVDNTEFLTRFQEKQMAAQPDFILEYHLEDHYQQKGIDDPEIYVESYAALNGRRSRPYVDTNVGLTEIEPSLKHRTWILPFDDEIKGL